MKKLLTFLTLLTLFFGVGWAGSYTYSLKSGSPGTWTVGSSDASTTSSDGFSFVVTDGGGNASASNIVQSAHIRIYANATMTITAPSGENITNVAITCVGTSNAGQLKVGDSNMTNTAASGAAPVYTWSGSGSNPLVVTASAQCRVNKIEITTSGGSQATTYNVNLTQTTGGTISASTTTAAEGATVTLTATPYSGYGFTSWTVLDENADEVTVTNNQFTMPASDVEVEATFTELTTHAITVNGGYANTTSAYQGQTVTVTPTIPSGKVLDQITTTPELTLTPSGDNYTFTMPNEAVTVTITYKDAPTYTNKFERITDLTQLTVGNGERYLLVCETSGKAHKGIGDDASAIEISNHSTTLTETSDVNIFTLGQVDGKYYLEYEYNGSTYYLGHKTNTSTGDNSIQGKTSNTVLSQWAITFEDGNAVITQTANDKTYNLRAYNDDFRVYTGTSNYNVQLYKEMASIEEVEDLYVVGQVNGNDENPIDTNEGIQLTYSQTSKTYSGDFYCTGVNNGNDSGYSFLLFSKKVPYSFSTTSDLYGAGGNGNAWTINESDLGTAIPLYATSTDNFRLSAGLYTVTVALTGAGFEWTDASVTFTTREKTMVINGSQYFDDTREVTMTSNLTDIGGKIYYTTDGSNPSDPNSSRQEYTGAITINETTTFKAVAFVGNLYSAIVEKTFTKTPKTPVIDPNGGTITEATQVTITCETTGAEIYYTLDGSTPTNVVSETNFLYSEPFTIAETTTVKARAYVGNTYSNNIATAEFVYTEPYVPGEGDFVLVDSKDDLKAGREYIIITEDYNWAMGAIDGDAKKATASQEFTISTDHSTVTLTENSTVNIIKLADGVVDPDNKYWNLTQTNGLNIFLQNTGTGIQEKLHGYGLSGYSDEVLINLTTTTNYAIITPGGRQILYQNGSNGVPGVFGHYANSNAGTSSYQRVYLYYREGATVPTPEMTLAQIESEGVVNTKYAIADPYLVGVASRDVEVDGKSYVYVWCKDNNNVTDKLVPASGVKDFMKQQGEQSGEWDQSNWVVLRFENDADAHELVGNQVTNIVGTYVDATNYMIDVESYEIGDEASYTPNVYCVANFNPSNWGVNGVQQPNASDADDPFYFFMTPKVQEYCKITFAEWNGTTFTVPTSSGFEGTLSLGWDYNEDSEGHSLTQSAVEQTLNANNVVQEGEQLPAYKFFAVVQKNSSKGAVTGASKVYPMNLEGGEGDQVPTAISTVTVNGDVKSVKYVNVAGMVSDVPFQGVNIVVTEYSDGSRSTSKMLRK